MRATTTAAGRRLAIIGLCCGLTAACGDRPPLFTMAAGSGGQGASGGQTNQGGTTAASGSTSPNGGFDPGTSSSGSTANGGITGQGGAAGHGGFNSKLQILNLKVEDNRDDCLWVGDSDERLVYSDHEWHIEVGADEERARAGLRFEVKIPQGSRIESAILRLSRVSGTASAVDTMQVHVYDSSDVPEFADAHVHGPEGHVDAGLYAQPVRGMPAGLANGFTESPDLSPLIQHVVDRPDWEGEGHIGFVLSALSMQTWVGYADSTSERGAAELAIFYVLP
ncbi:MAG TPA: hypothetical protein VFQ61_22530 [Polyangiaceae bacterium]|nr:hypothetical protein [Polyangiaceae bacterium]